MVESKSSEMFYFELIVIDNSGASEIVSERSFLFALMGTDKLWKEPKQKSGKGNYEIIDGDIKVKIKTASVLNDLIEASFAIQVESKNFERIEAFRYRFLIHLRNRLKFNHIRLVSDDVSNHIAKQIYPLINDLETALRRYISKFFTQKIGPDWWNKAVPETTMRKISERKKNEKVFAPLLETDLALIDFNDLGDIIYKHKFGFNKPESLTERINALKNDELQEQVDKLKSDLNSNYTKYFQENFKAQNFEKKWKELFEVRNKVAHNNLFTKKDLDRTTELHADVLKIIKEAENKIDEFNFSTEEQESIRRQTGDDIVIEAITNAITSGELSLTGDLNKSGKPTENNDEESGRDLTEEIFLDELDGAAHWVKTNPSMDYIGLKWFVFKVLVPSGYDYSSSYALANILQQKGEVEIYDIENEDSSYTVKAIKKIIHTT